MVCNVVPGNISIGAMVVRKLVSEWVSISGM